MLPLRRAFAIVALVLMIAPLVARAPLFDPDEGLHAAIAQEMARTGDYVTPRFLGEPFLDKPILFFWAEALSLRAFGMNEAAVRIPPLLFGLLGMVSVAALGRALFGERAGLMAGLVYGTMLLPLGVSQVAVHDVAIVPFMCAGVYLLLRSADAVNLPAALGAGVSLGLSILTKGLVGVVFAGIFAVCFAVSRRETIWRLGTALAIAIVVAAFVAAPWYVLMERAHPGYLHYYFVERHLQGYLTSTQRHAGRAWWYYVPIVIGGSLPWTGYLARAARTARANRLRLVVWGWLAVGFVFLSVGESKLATYALPLFPALAILIAEVIDSNQAAIDRVGYYVYAITLAVIPVGAALALRIKFGGVTPTIWVTTGVLSAVIAVIALPRVPRTPRPEMFVLSLLGLMIVVPRAAAWMTGKDVALELNTTGHLPPHVLVLEERVGSLIFYLAPALRAEADPGRVNQGTMAGAIQRSRAEPLDGIVIVRNNLLERFERQFAVPPEPAWTAGTNTIFRVKSVQDALRGIR